jgi:hypothetical protein
MNTKLQNVPIQARLHPVMKMLVMAVFFCGTVSLNAQVERNQVYNIFLGEVRYSNPNERLSSTEAFGQIMRAAVTGKAKVQAPEYQEMVKTAVVNGLSRAYRYRLSERQAQIGDESEVGNLLADVNITNIAASSETSSYKDKNGKTHVSVKYNGEVDVTITLTDVGTGDVLGTPSFSASGYSSTVTPSQEEAFRNGMGLFVNRITSWLNQTLPLQANIIEGNAVKKEKQKTVYIDLGTREGAYAGIHFGVYVVKTVAGREARLQIGKLKIESVQGDDISLCKVQSGGKDIKKALEAGEKLLVISL